MWNLVGVAGLSWVSLLLTTTSAGTAVGSISLVAGGGGPGHGGDGGPAVTAQLTFPEDCETDLGGIVYVAEDGRIRKIAADGVITTFAGGGPPGALGEGGPATGSDVWPAALAVDATGTLYVADFNPSHPRVLAILPDGTLHRIAGTGEGPGYSGDGGIATDARIGQPLSLALTGDAVYFTDAQSGAVRRVDFATRRITAVSQLAGSYEIAAGPDGALYASSLTTQSIVALGRDGQVRPVAGVGSAGFSGDGGPATSAALAAPVALAVDAVGRLFVSDADNHRIRRIDVDGTIATIAGTGVEGVTGDGGPALAATLVFPRGLGIDAAGALCIADTGGGVVRSIDGAAAPRAPTIVTIPATGSPLTGLSLSAVCIAVGASLVVLARLRRQQRPVA
jgi:sugar lactone lactonase YvrE